MTPRLAATLALTLAAACHTHSTRIPAEPEIEAPPSEVPAPTAALQGGAIVLSEPIEFEGGAATIAASSEDVLTALGRLLAERTDLTTLRIEGHSDSQGDDSLNQRLTEARARAVARWLAAAGIDCQRLVPVGFGETKPIADNATAEGRKRNRRIELVPAALRGHPIGGMPVDGGGQVAGDACD